MATATYLRTIILKTPNLAGARLHITCSLPSETASRPLNYETCLWINKFWLMSMLTGEGLQVHCSKLESFRTLTTWKNSSASSLRVKLISSSSTVELARNVWMPNSEVHIIVASKNFWLTSVSETYRFFLQNCQCKLIFLALCHDNGYIAELDKYRNDVLAKKKTWLVDHYAKGRAFVNPPFHMVKLDNVFDTRAISVKRLNPAYLLNTNSSYSSTAVPSFTTEKAPIPEQNPYSNPPPHFTSASGASPINATRYDSNREMVEKDDAPYLAPGVEPPTSADEVPVACLSQDTITRKVCLFSKYLLTTRRHAQNRSGQRIDDPIQPPWPVEQQHFEARIHQRKLCNEYYLRGYCPDRNCRFDHSPIDEELKKTLRFTARKVVCRAGAACRRADCYYGHRCPFASCDRRRCPFAKAGLHEVTDLEIVAFASSGGGGG